MTKAIFSPLSLIFILALGLPLSVFANSSQSVILNPASPPSGCGYYYNGNEGEAAGNEASYTENNNYWTETYSTKPKNPYPYYGSACNNNTSPNVVVAVPPAPTPSNPMPRR